RCWYHGGQPLGCGEVFVRGPAPPSGASRLRVAPCSTVRSCFYPGDRFTLERPNTIGVGKVLQEYSRLGERNRQGERAMHLLAEAEGLSGPFSVIGDRASRTGLAGGVYAQQSEWHRRPASDRQVPGQEPRRCCPAPPCQARTMPPVKTPCRGASIAAHAASAPSHLPPCQRGGRKPVLVRRRTACYHGPGPSPHACTGGAPS